MLKELDVGKKDIASKLIKNAPRPPGKFTPANNLFGSQTQTLTREKEETKDKVLEEIDEKIHDIPDLPKLELGNGLVSHLGAEAKDILEGKLVNSKKLEDDALENIKEGHGFEEIKDAFDEGTVPEQLEFFYGGENEIFARACNFWSLGNVNREFIAFIISDIGKNIMTNSSLSKHIESENIFHQNFNTNENFYSFHLAQQEETKAIISKRIWYHYSFEKYVKNIFLLSQWITLKEN